MDFCIGQLGISLWDKTHYCPQKQVLLILTFKKEFRTQRNLSPVSSRLMPTLEGFLHKQLTIRSLELSYT